MLKGVIKKLLATATKTLHHGPGGNTLPQGVTLRPVLLNETLVFYCTTCDLQHRHSSRDDGVVVEIQRADGRLYALEDNQSTTNCLSCHQPTPFPLLCTNEQAARQLAHSIDPVADYECVRIEPKEPR